MPRSQWERIASTTCQMPNPISASASNNRPAGGAAERCPGLWRRGRSALCFATTNRQSALAEIAPRCDAVIVIGSANSSNTRALEQAPGFDLIIDDTPEAVTISSFDPVRREIARVALNRLIMDGRIHPARIEEMATKATQEVEHDTQQSAQQSAAEQLRLTADYFLRLGDSRGLAA